MNRFDLAYGALLALVSPLLLGLRLLRPALWAKASLKLFAPLPPVPPKQSLRLWLHGASLGEVRLALRIIERLRALRPGWDYVVSCNSQSGWELAAKEHAGLNFILPFDFSPRMQALVSRLEPDHLILVEAEVWPNLLAALPPQAKLLVANARLSEKHFPQYLRFHRFFGRLFDQACYLQPGDQQSAQRLRQLGVSPNKIHFAGNFKFVLPRPQPEESIRVLRATHALGKEFVVLGASLQPNEVPILLQAFRQMEPQGAHLVLIPRHPEKREQFLAQFAALGFAPNRPQPGQGQVHLIDQWGVLPQWYQAADVVFVGGSFGKRGGQNMLEPCGLGKPVAVGPDIANFADEAATLQAAQGLVQVQDAAGLGEFFARCRRDPAYAQALGQAAQACVAHNAGALEVFCQQVMQEVE